MSDSLRMLSTLAVMGALREVAADLGGAVEIDFAPTQKLLERIAAGEQADVAILTDAAATALAADGVILADSVTPLVLSRVGLAVAPGTPHPRIGTVAEFVDALQRAQSIAYSQSGASGQYFARLIGELGIEATVSGKAIVVSGGLTAELLRDGRAEIAIQQISELMAVPGIEIVGSFPQELASESVFTAGVLRRARDTARAREWVRTLAGAEAARVYARNGLAPPPG